MKKLITLTILAFSLWSHAQNGITYQAVILNPNSEELPGVDNSRLPLVNQNVTLEFKILNAKFLLDYQETINTETDVFGMVNVVIGTGTRKAGIATQFSGINWDGSAKTLIVSLDPSGQASHFIEISNQPFTYVPFALYAAHTGVAGTQGPAGNNGLDGKTVLNGTTNPIASLGTNGDFYINTASSSLFGPKTNDIWGNSVSLVGPQGIQGATGLQGTAGTNGTNGSNGNDGLSAYQIWLNAGNTGTEVQFLTTLRGATGAQGPQGIQGLQGPTGLTGLTGATGSQGIAGTNGTNGLSAYQIWLNAGNTGTEAQFLTALRGATGAQGVAGTNGINGTNGLSAYQIWLNTGNTGTEAQFLTALRGATGAQGPQGIQGLQGPTGLTGATGSQGIAGTNGTNGLSAYQIWLNAGNTGTEAQFLTALRGATGAQGAQGIQGIAGPQGPIGLTGPQGIQGPAGTNGTNGLDGKNTLVNTTSEPTGANCANGGTKIEVGLDTNNNGILDSGEVNSSLTKYVCNGTTGQPSLSTNVNFNLSNIFLLNNTTTYTVPSGKSARISQILANSSILSGDRIISVNGTPIYLGSTFEGTINQTDDRIMWTSFLVNGEFWLPSGTTISILSNTKIGFLSIQETDTSNLVCYLVTNTVTVPNGKKWKISSILPNTNLNGMKDFVITINNSSVYVGASKSSAYYNAGASGNSYDILKNEIWLPEGSSISPGLNIYGISIIEY